MRTSKILAGSALAIAAAMQIGMGGVASAAEGETLAVAAAAVDGDGNLKVDVLYTCATDAKHKMLSISAEEMDKDGKAVAEGTGTGKLVITEYDPETKKNTEAPGCNGEEQRLTVTIEPDDEAKKFVKGGMGTVTVSFSDDVQFNAKQSGVKFISRP
ncbi:hypothetical protein ACIA8C_36525 [Nocardia sp. NPDC051321]|uniref:hypothetical protein n=1 Tax=Nocardia sp. NPDC051321 TaxID=3364323 RepID=UPI0037984B87